MNLLPVMFEQSLVGLKVTLSVFAVTLLLSLPLSLLVARLRMSPNAAVRRLVAAYIYAMRGTPLLLQLMFVFFGLPFLPVIGVTLDRMPAIYLAFVLNYTAYFAEIFRGGLASIDGGQWEACKVLGIGKAQAFFRIILPQVVKNVLPSVGNEVIALIKDTSLVYILGVTDVLKVARGISNSYSTFVPYIFVGGVYLAMTAVLTRALGWIENKFQYYK